MTATIHWVKELIESEGFKVIDKTDECVNLRPKKIEVISHNEAKEILLEASNENKIIYMLPSAKEAYDLENEFITCQLRDDVVAITSSPREGISSTKERKEREDSTYKMLVEENMFPDDANILLNTTKLREGVNIVDDRVRYCISECHSSVDIRQFAGRVRTGIEKLYIVEDKKQNRNYVSEFEKSTSCKLIFKFDDVIKDYMDSSWGFGEQRKYYAEVDTCKAFFLL